MKHLKTFAEKCSGCETCMRVCSTLYFKKMDPERSAILVTPHAVGGAGGFDLNVCDQCQTCVAECPTLALTVNAQGVVLLNKNLCIHCYACVAACPTGAMRRHMNEMAPFKCIACGACAKECPEGALVIVNEERKP